MWAMADRGSRQCGAAAQMRASVLRVGAGQGAFQVGVQAQDAYAAKVSERPWLGVVQRGRRCGVRHEGRDGVLVKGFCGHGDFPSLRGLAASAGKTAARAAGDRPSASLRIPSPACAPRAAPGQGPSGPEAGPSGLPLTAAWLTQVRTERR
jgi:hypothetical protein